MSEVVIHLVVAAFDEEGAAEEALKTLKESRDEKLVGIQSALAVRKDKEGQIHFKDVGLTPSKGAVGGVVLGAAVGILTGGTGLALGALGALVGGLVGKKKRDSRFPTGQINQLAASLTPGSSAVLIVMQPGWVVVLEKELEAMGADVLTASIPADLAEQLKAGEDAAYAVLENELGVAMGQQTAGDKEMESTS